MNNREINEFIEEREKYGESWEQDQVREIYGDSSLADALEDVEKTRDKYNI